MPSISKLLFPGGLIWNADNNQGCSCTRATTPGLIKTKCRINMKDFFPRFFSAGCWHFYFACGAQLSSARLASRHVAAERSSQAALRIVSPGHRRVCSASSDAFAMKGGESLERLIHRDGPTALPPHAGCLFHARTHAWSRLMVNFSSDAALLKTRLALTAAREPG